MKNKKIAIAGAGISGLSAGWKLQKNGFEVTIFERRDRPGGSIRTEKYDGWLVEYGPNSIRLKSKRVLGFLKNAGLAHRITEANPEADKRFVVKGGRLQDVPAGVGEFIRTPLFSTTAKLKMLKEPFVRRGEDPDETLASFVTRRLGEEVLDYAVNPFVAGVYAGSPDQLSVQHAFPALYRLEQDNGSLIAGAAKKVITGKNGDAIKPRLISFNEGLQELPEVLANQMEKIHYNTGVDRVQLNQDGWEILAGGVRFGPYDQLILNIPLYRFSEQLIEGGGELLKTVQYTSYPALSVVVTGFESGQIKHPMDGYGFLVPEAENRNILGTLFNSTLFPNRAPEGNVLLTSFVGGSRQPELASLESEKMKKMVCRELDDLLGIDGSPVFFDHIYWPRSIPQYTTDYQRVLDAIQALESLYNELYIIGNFKGGIALPDCIMNGVSLADRIISKAS